MINPLSDRYEQRAESSVVSNNRYVGIGVAAAFV